MGNNKKNKDGKQGKAKEILAKEEVEDLFEDGQALEDMKKPLKKGKDKDMKKEDKKLKIKIKNKEKILSKELKRSQEKDILNKDGDKPVDVLVMPKNLNEVAEDTISMERDERFRNDMKIAKEMEVFNYNEDTTDMDEELDLLAEKLSYLQRRLMALKVPAIIILEGAYAAGKGRVANELLIGLDARYTKFWATRHPSEDDLKNPFLTQYYKNIPQSNNFTIFYRSWYSLYSYYKNSKINKDRYKRPEVLIDEIKNFEKTLADNGYCLMKFKIRVNPKKQAEHIRKMMDSPLTTWKAQEYDRDNNEIYVKEMEKLMYETSTDYAPWYIVEYTSKKETTTKIMKHVIEILEKKLEEVLNKKEVKAIDKDGRFTGNLEGALSKVDLSKTLSEEEYEIKLKDLQEKMREVQYALYQEKIPLILVFEGWDAAGKGGGIQRIITKLDPTNYTVNTTAAPNDVEKNHHYLWRFAIEMPRAGHIAIWDRSWYGRVMVERIEGFATNEEWQRAYKEINDFERMFTNFNAIVLKFFLHIDKETQLERFNARQENPKKSWKITDEDWRNRDKWDKYVEAVNDMIEKTSTELAPWIVIEGNSKHYARVKILQKIIEECDKRLKSINYFDNSNEDKKTKDRK